MNRLRITLPSLLLLLILTTSVSAQEPPAQTPDVAGPITNQQLSPLTGELTEDAPRQEMEALEAKLLELTQDRESLQTQLRETRLLLGEARQQAESLGLQLETLRQEGCGNLPSNFTSVELAWVTDTTAVIAAGLNRAGIISAKLYSLAGGARSPQLQSKTSDFKEQHQISFSELSPQSEYEIELIVLNFRNQETKIRADAESHPKDLRVKTLVTPPTPVITSETTPTHDKIKVVITATEDVHLRVSCMEHLPDKASPREAGVEGGDLVLSAVGPRGGIRILKGESRTLEFSAKPSTQYSVEWAGYSAATGLKIPPPHNDFDKFSTPALPVALAFDGGFSFTLTPTQVELQWKSTKRPSTASVHMLVGDNDYRVINALLPSIKEDGVSVKINSDALSAAAAPQRPLRLRAVMTDERDKPVSADFEIAVRLDPTEEGLTKDQKESIKKIQEVVTREKGRIDWRELAKTGLPIILSLL